MLSAAYPYLAVHHAGGLGVLLSHQHAWEVQACLLLLSLPCLPR